ncbi:MAG TPA: CocE/NonD family hydrolase [Acidimicrobiales bacterium]|nr:CocE/NonD family hydrolase [Acidimicrobiales bacterium]
MRPPVGWRRVTRMVAGLAAVAGGLVGVPIGGATTAAAASGASGTSGASGASGAWTPPAARFGEGAALNLPVVAGDGTVLRVDVYYPTSPCSSAVCSGPPATVPGGFPALLQQTPYGKQSIAQAGSNFATDIPAMVHQGYVVAISDIRGTGVSGGTWGLFDPVQATDGATIVRWLADELPASVDQGGVSAAVHGLSVNGSVGLFGASYMAIDEFLTVAALDADGGPNPVKAMFPMISGNDLFRDTVAEGGLPDVEFSAAYLALLEGLDTANPLLDPLEEQYVDYQAGTSQPSALVQQLAAGPVTSLGHGRSTWQYDIPTVLSVETGGAQAYDGNAGIGRAASAGSSYWAARNPVNVLGELVHDNIAAFLVGGWNDLFQRGELLNYTGLQNAWYDATTGAQQSVLGPMQPGQPTTPRYQLLMGPWTHITAGSGSDLAADELEWFAAWMPGPASDPTVPIAHTANPLHLYTLESGNWNDKQHTGQWIDTADWPVPDAADTGYVSTKLYFAGGPGGAPALSDNRGGLTTVAPTAKRGADTVVFTGAGSPCSLPTDQWSAGGLHEGEANGGSNFTFPCDRQDATVGTGPGALTYTSGPLKNAAVIAGPIDATVYATDTAKDAELVATIEEVSPHGQSVPLTSGALLGSMRAEVPGATWTGDDGAPLLPFHPYTSQSTVWAKQGRIYRYDIEVFPTFALVPKGWSIRITLATADTPHLEPSLAQLPRLLGGVYQVQRNAVAASFVNLPLVTATSFTTPCPAYVCTEGSGSSLPLPGF